MQNYTASLSIVLAAASLSLVGCAATPAVSGSGSGLDVTVTSAGDRTALHDDMYERFAEGDRLCALGVTVVNTTDAPIQLNYGQVTMADESSPAVSPGYDYTPDEGDSALANGLLGAGSTVGYTQVVTCDLGADAGATVQIHGEVGVVLARVPVVVE